MAFGDLVLFNALAVEIGDGTHDLDLDAFSVALITQTVGAGITAADAAHSLSSYTEVTGPGYTAGGYSLTPTWVRTTNVAKFNADDALWSQAAGGPGGINAGLLYNVSSGVGVGYIDLNDAGSASIDTDNISITWDNTANAIFAITV
jgi:hypothetical protein